MGQPAFSIIAILAIFSIVAISEWVAVPGSVTHWLCDPFFCDPFFADSSRTKLGPKAALSVPYASASSSAKASWVEASRLAAQSGALVMMLIT